MSNHESNSERPTTDDVVRHKYRVLAEVEKLNMQAVKDHGQGFLDLCDQIPGDGRELALARTKIEEAVMWAVKHITQ